MTATNFLGKGSFTGDEDRAFPGRVEVWELEAGQYGEQYHIGVRPLTFEIKGASGQFQSWYKNSKAKNSTLFNLVAALEDQCGFVFSTEKGQEIIGKDFMWVRKEISFGKNHRTGEEMKSKPTLIPTKAVTQDEVDELVKAAGDKAPTGGAGGVGGTASASVVKPTQTVELSDEDLGTIAAAVIGKNKMTAVAGAIANKLPQPLIQAVIDGRALKALTSKGILVEDESGILKAA